MKRGGDRETLRRDPFCGERCFDLRDGLGGARENHLGGGVVVRDHHVGANRREERADFVDGAGNGSHRAGHRSSVAHQLTAATRNLDERCDVERACFMERGHFSEAVSGNAARTNSHRVKHVGERHALDAERGLGPLGRGELLRLRVARFVGEDRTRKDHVVHALAIELLRSGGVPRCAGHVERHRDIGAHADVLRPLPRIQECDLARVCGAHGAMDARGRGERRVGRFRDRGCSLGELVGKLLRARSDHGEARSIARLERSLTVAGNALEIRRPRSEGLASRHELSCIRCAQEDELGRRRAVAPRRFSFAGAVVSRDVLLERDVEVAAAETEARNRRAARVRGIADPRAALGVQVKRALLDIQLGARAIDLDRRRKHLVMQRHHGLEEPRSAGRSLGVTDLRFDGAERAPLGVFARRLAERDVQTFELGRVACLGARSVRFDELDGSGIVPRHFVGAAKRAGLSFGERRVDALATSVGRRPDTREHGVDAIAVTLGIFEPLESEHRHALAEERAVCRVGEGAAVAGGRERGRLAEAHVHEDVVHRVDAARDHEIRLPELELVHAHGHGRHGARAGCVGHCVGSAQIEAVRDAPGDHVSEEPGER